MPEHHAGAVEQQWARALHARCPLVDTHSHFLLNGHYLRKDFGRRHAAPWFWNPLRNVVDLPRLRQGGVACSTFTVYVPPPPLRITAWAACARMLDTLDRIVESNPVVKVDTAAGVRAAFARGRLAALPAVEGGHVLGRRAGRVRELRERGVRILTLTHFIANRICDATVGPEVHGGLSDFGREVISACEACGVVVDLAHASEKAFYQALEALELPPLVTHTAWRGERSSERYLSADQVRAVGQRGGGIGVILWPWYLERGGLRSGLDVVAEHYARFAELAGCESLLLGTDMDGYTWMPRGFHDAADLPLLTAALRSKGFSEPELCGLLGGNALRILETWERAASG